MSIIVNGTTLQSGNGANGTGPITLTNGVTSNNFRVICAATGSAANGNIAYSVVSLPITTGLTDYASATTSTWGNAQAAGMGDKRSLTVNTSAVFNGTGTYIVDLQFRLTEFSTSTNCVHAFFTYRSDNYTSNPHAPNQVRWLGWGPNARTNNINGKPMSGSTALGFNSSTQLLLDYCIIQGFSQNSSLPALNYMVMDRCTFYFLTPSLVTIPQA